MILRLDYISMSVYYKTLNSRCLSGFYIILYACVVHVHAHLCVCVCVCSRIKLHCVHFDLVVDSVDLLLCMSKMLACAYERACVGVGVFWFFSKLLL